MVAKVAIVLLPLLALVQCHTPTHPTSYKAYPHTQQALNIDANDKRFRNTAVDENDWAKNRDTGKDWNDRTLKEQGNKKGMSFNTDDTKYIQMPDDGCGNGGGAKYANSKTGKDFNVENTNKFETTSGGKVWDNMGMKGNDRAAREQEAEFRGYGLDNTVDHHKHVYPTYNNNNWHAGGVGLPFRAGYAHPAAAYGYGDAWGFGGKFGAPAAHGHGKWAAPVAHGWGDHGAHGWGKAPAPAANWGKWGGYGKYPVDSCAAPPVDACYF